MHDRDEQKQGFVEQNRKLLDVTVWISQCLIKPMEVFLTRPGTAGAKYLGGMHALVGVVAMPLGFMTLLPPESKHLQPDAMVPFTIAAVAWLLVHRVRAARLARGGYRCHTMNVGRSVFFGMESRWAFQALHPAAFLAATAALTALTGAGCLVLYGALTFAASIVNGMWQDAAHEAQLRDAEDAMFEQRAMAEELKRRGW